MSAHWWLALRYAAWVAVAAVVASAAVWAYFGVAEAAAFWYGVGVGLASFVSAALSVSLLANRSMRWRAVGGVSFMVRYGLVAAALGVPAYFGMWPAVAMLGGFVGVYLVENVAILSTALGALGRAEKSAGRRAIRRTGEGVESSGSGGGMEKKVIA